MPGAEGWQERLLSEDSKGAPRQHEQGNRVVFRADAAFTKPELYEALEERGVNCAVPFRPMAIWSGTSRNG